MNLEYIVFIGAAAGLAGMYFYVRDTLRGDTKPNKVSWLMWSIAPLIATVAALSDGVRLAVIPVFISGFTPLIGFVVSFFNKKAYWKLTKFDYTCGTFSALALILWLITKEPNVAIVFAILSDGFAAIPTLVKSWKYPETESGLAYVGGFISAATGFFAIKHFGFSESAFIIYLTILSTGLIFAIYRKRLSC